MAKQLLSNLPLVLLAYLASPEASAADPKDGQALHEANCVKCHSSTVYTRPNRRVTTLPGLHKQVRFCEQQLELKWFDEEIQDVAQYLNNDYYKFSE